MNETPRDDGRKLPPEALVLRGRPRRAIRYRRRLVIALSVYWAVRREDIEPPRTERIRSAPLAALALASGVGRYSRMLRTLARLDLLLLLDSRDPHRRAAPRPSGDRRGSA